MNRLTFKKRFDFYNPDEETTTACINNHVQIVVDKEEKHFYLAGEVINKLSEYEDAEEQGMLVRLPCRVGDSVYILFPNTGFVMKSVVEEFVFSKMVHVVTFNKNFIYRRAIPYCEIGKTLFLTKSEAVEAANKAMEGQK